MVFSSSVFLFIFLPITICIYYLLRKTSLQNIWLLFVSFIFFSWSQPKYIALILISIGINYMGAIIIEKYSKHKGLVLFFVIGLNISLLFYYKYFGFSVHLLNKIAKSTFSIPDIILPIGISFFTFQGISYVVDVYRGTVPLERNVINVALYISMFPQLIAGPIVRYSDINKTLTNRQVQFNDLCNGIERFILGLSKKVIIANTLAILVDSIWNKGSHNHTAVIAWIVSIAYTLQIYFDFSGYSDMAIGLGKMFGFSFPENFNLPYISESITEFWRRWHISLSSWFKDYVYIPLGGNRKRVYINLFIVFLLTGVWHGAAEHYILWGIWNGLFIIGERFLSKRFAERNIPDNSVIKCFKKVYTLLVVNIGWVLFRASYIGEAKSFIKCMFGKPGIMPTDNSIWWYLDRWTLFIFAIGIILSSSIPRKMIGIIKNNLSENVYISLKYVFLTVLFVLSITRVISGTYNPFIYYQF